MIATNVSAGCPVWVQCRHRAQNRRAGCWWQAGAGQGACQRAGQRSGGQRSDAARKSKAARRCPQSYHFRGCVHTHGCSRVSNRVASWGTPPQLPGQVRTFRRAAAGNSTFIFCARVLKVSTDHFQAFYPPASRQLATRVRPPQVCVTRLIGRHALRRARREAPPRHLCWPTPARLATLATSPPLPGAAGAIHQLLSSRTPPGALAQRPF